MTSLLPVFNTKNNNHAHANTNGIAPSPYASTSFAKNHKTYVILLSYG